MMLFESGVYKIDIDIERTRNYYENEGQISCDCASCRNFLQAYKHIPAEIRQFFEAIGVSVEKPDELSPNFGYNIATANYGATYYVCGTILEGTNPWIQVDSHRYQINEQYYINPHEDCSLYFSASPFLLHPGKPSPTIEMQVQFQLPWVLDEPNAHFIPRE